jgi:hypothetical protein
MYVTVVGIFDSERAAEEARRELLAVGVPERRIVLDLNQDGLCRVGVRTQSSLERERIRDLLQRNGASCSEHT